MCIGIARIGRTTTMLSLQGRSRLLQPLGTGFADITGQVNDIMNRTHEDRTHEEISREVLDDGDLSEPMQLAHVEDQEASRACSRSAIKSSAFSIPQDMRIILS